ncbi:MAG: sensor domain-containing diguanylate cyclase [bacterium]|nr:sensor domain-containing diguanylate cyclase [bacterium]
MDNMEKENEAYYQNKAEDLEMFEKKIYDLKNLIGLGISLSSNLDFESLVESILYSCIGQMFVEKVAILLQQDLDVDNFCIHMTKGYDTEFDSNEIFLEDNSSIIKYLEEHPKPHEYSFLANLPHLKDGYERLQVLSPKMIIPMKSKNFLNGMIVLGDKITGQEFTANEIDFLQDLAKFAAIAVENSRLYLMATLDRMTRLYIHHYFQERLLEEIKRTLRTGGALSLIMMDIDFFKRFNDTYGHQQGDLILKEVARLIKEHIRSIDIPARYGGEEFAIILPQTDLEGAIVIANRIRIEIGKYEFAGQDEPLHITMSLGVAQYDSEIDNSKDELVKRADEALYTAKENGRNKVIAHKGNSGD